MTWTYILYSYLFLPSLAIAYVIFGVWLTYHVVARKKSMFGKASLAIAISLTFLLIPTTDVIVGRVSFSRLCETAAGIKVTQVAVLDNRYRRADGYPKVEIIPGQSRYLIGDRYEVAFVEKEVLGWPRITEVIAEVRDKQRGDVLGRRVDFHYWGGWLTHQMPGHIRAETCPQLRLHPTSLEQMVFQVAK
jgi:hypothetical protein